MRSHQHQDAKRQQEALTLWKCPKACGNHTSGLSLVELEKGIKGLVVMSSSLEETFHCIYDARVPPLWEKAYPSLKPLAAWTRDLCQRVDQFAHWAETAQPPNLFWLSGFTFPNGFLTAVLQSSARQHNISVDTLSWEFIVSTVDDSNLLDPPKDGVFVRGLYLEGAGWDKKNSCLVEAEPMQMVCPIPTIHFKPVENRKKMAKSEMFERACQELPSSRAFRGLRHPWPRKEMQIFHYSTVFNRGSRHGTSPADCWIAHKRGAICCSNARLHLLRDFLRR
ncbi:hypothetical protein PAMP_015570 [Pampus punctatissimus]